MRHKEIQAEISRRKNVLRRSNFQENEYREEMKKLQDDEKVTPCPTIVEDERVVQAVD